MIRNKSGQVAVFVIIAVLLAGGIIAYYAVQGKIWFSSIPKEVQPVFEHYKQCISEETKNGIEIAGSQGGRIVVDKYESGSSYSPFSSQLNFLGTGVPYWSYVSGNGIIRENVPMKSEIEGEIADFVSERIKDCNFESFYNQGFVIGAGEPEVKVSIGSDNVKVDVNSKLSVKKGEVSGVGTKHSVEINSRFGKLYDNARNIYAKEKSEMFLEKYSVDVLRSYAPVDGVEITCSPKIWKGREVADELRKGFEANLGMLKFGNYKPSDKKKEYFSVEKESDVPIRVLYSPQWPDKVEVSGGEDELLIAEPTGNQEGMGAMGFCYAPYHFVWDISFPALIQLGDGNDVFQFPVVVVIDNNEPRKFDKAISSASEEEFDLCKFKTEDMKVELFDVHLNPVEGNISYVCFDQRCFLGESKNGVLNAKAPACLNGQILVRADGFAEKKELFSSNSGKSAEIVLDREYNSDVEVRVGGRAFSGNAIVHFSEENGRVYSAVLPETQKMRIKEGFYNVSVYAYGNTNIEIPATRKTQCYDASAGGILGLFGQTKEECVDIEVPAVKIESALTGGGKGEVYILPGDLEKGKIVINVPEFPSVSSLEQMQMNYELFDNSNVEVSFG